MHFVRLCKLTSAAGAASLLAVASIAQAQPAASPGTDAFRTAGAAAVIQAQLTAVVSQFSEITRVFRGCNVGGGIVGDGSGCADGVNGRLNDFFVIQGTLRDSSIDPNGLGVPNGSSLGQVTYRLSGNGAGNGIACSADPSVQAPTPTGFLAPEGLDGVPNTADDAGGSGVFGVPGPGTNPGTASQTAAPLVNCQGKTRVEQAQTVSGTINTFLTAANAELCVVDTDLNGNGSIGGQNNGAGLPGAVASVGGVAGNETSNLRLACDTGVTAPPPGDFNPPRATQRSQTTVGGQLYKIVTGRDVHAIGNADAKIRLNDAQLEGIFGAPSSNSVCRLDHLGAESSGTTQNVTACTRAVGAGVREAFRNSFMANTAGSKVLAEDPSGLPDGTISQCIQPREGGGTQIAQKRVKLTNIINEQLSCVAGFSGGFSYVDADRFDPGTYGVVIEGVDPDAALLAPPDRNLKQLVKCGHYRYWQPVSVGVGGNNPGGSPFITAHVAALGDKPVLFEASASFLPTSTIGFVKSATDGSYSVSFVPTSCPAAPPPPLAISEVPDSF